MWQSLAILFGIVGVIIVFGMVTSLIEVMLGPWKKLGAAYPAQPVREDQSPERGEAMVAWTKKPYFLEQDARRGCLGRLGILGVLAGVIGVGALVWFAWAWASGSLASGSTMWFLMGGVSAGWAVMVLGFGFRFLSLKAFHRPVRYATDDEHLHLTREGSGGVGSARVSIPWEEIEPIEVDPMTLGEKVCARFCVGGERWAHGWMELVKREMAVRGIGMTPTPAEGIGVDNDEAGVWADGDGGVSEGGPASGGGRGRNDWGRSRGGDNWGDV
jgi:hypothetical protein